jgi:hypothetical protein
MLQCYSETFEIRTPLGHSTRVPMSEESLIQGEIRSEQKIS